MSESRAFCVARVVLDVFLASLGAIGIYLFKLFGSKFLHKSGFHCSDETLAYPYKPSTIPSAINGSVGVIVPALIIVADHFVKAKRIFIRLDKAVVVKTLGKIFPVLIVFLAGCSLQHIVTDIGKYQIGRLRPHFFDVCRPQFEINGEILDCSSEKVLPYKLIEFFNCTNQKYSASRQKEARISFPSGHSSFAFFAMTFAFIYVHFRLPLKFASFCGSIPRPVIQFGCLWWAWLVCISRLFDNKHHTSDIIAGAVIGVVVAVFFAIVVLGLHKEDEQPFKESRTESVPVNADSADWGAIEDKTISY